MPVEGHTFFVDSLHFNKHFNKNTLGRKNVLLGGIQRNEKEEPLTELDDDIVDLAIPLRLVGVPKFGEFRSNVCWTWHSYRQIAQK